MSDTPSVLIVCNDLFFSSQLHNAGKRAGYATRTALSQEQAVRTLTVEPAAWVIIDLELAPMDLTALCQAVHHCGGKAIAFGPHVHEELLSGAQQAGCDVVLTRGQAAATLDRILASSP